MEWYLKVMRDNYANFRGRARRKEYWMFTLVNVIIMIASIVVRDMYGRIVFMMDTYTICALIHFIPSLAVTVRRLHDIGKSGWFYLIVLIPLIGPIWLLVLHCTEGQKEDNKWGPDPKA